MTDIIPQTVQPTFTRARRESYSTTDESVQIRHPEESERPHSPTIRGMRFKRTLKQFSLEGKITVVTGGARGLGLVMSQAIITSGSDLAIVDLNSKPACPLLPGFLHYLGVVGGWHANDCRG